MTELQKESVLTGLLQKEFLQTEVLQKQLSDYLFKNIVIQKLDSLEQQVAVIGDKFKEQEQIFHEKSTMDNYLFLEDERKKGRTRKKAAAQTIDCWYEVRKIVKRALEILTEWEDAEDIKIQIQYAAIIVGKIDNIKKKEIVRSDDVRNKICTLLRNVIRLNASEDLFSKEQISVLKEGFSFVQTENIQKEDLFQLNRKLRKKGLSTMPAWE